MKPLFTQLELNQSKSRDSLLCVCYNCNNPYYVQKNYILRHFKHPKLCPIKYCSKICKNKKNEKILQVDCKQCNKTFKKKFSETKRSANHFCCSSCSGLYNSTHKQYGTRRSKLEIYIEEQIREKYPKLNLICNNITTINSELDFYFPDIKIAIEINGIFHYEPIYGEEKLSKIQKNDENKLLKCQKTGITLINIKATKNFTNKTKNEYWQMIKSIIDNKLNPIN